MIEAPRIVYVEDEWITAECVIKEITKSAPQSKVEHFSTASDFLEQVPNFIVSPPDLFIVNIGLPWTFPRPEPPIRPAKYKNSTGGFFLHQEIYQQPTLKTRPLIFCSVLEFARPSSLWKGNQSFKDIYFLQEHSNFPNQIAEDAREVLANRPPKHAFQLQ